MRSHHEQEKNIPIINVISGFALVAIVMMLNSHTNTHWSKVELHLQACALSIPDYFFSSFKCQKLVFDSLMVSQRKKF